MDNIPVPYEHQQVTTDFIVDNPKCMITSDPGTGKTRAVLDAIKDFKGRTLVLAPLSILEAAWGEDIKKFTPALTYEIAYAKNRQKVFETSTTDLVITNFEAVNFLIKNKKLLREEIELLLPKITELAFSLGGNSKKKTVSDYEIFNKIHALLLQFLQKSVSQIPQCEKPRDSRITISHLSHSTVSQS